MLHLKCTHPHDSFFFKILNIVSFYGIVALMSFSCFLSWFHQRFFCGGRLIFGPDVASIFLSMLLIAAPAIGFCIKVYNKILDKGTKNPARWYPVFFVGSILTVLVSISFSIWLQAVLTIGRIAIYLFLKEAQQLNEMQLLWDLAVCFGFFMGFFFCSL